MRHSILACVSYALLCAMCAVIPARAAALASPFDPLSVVEQRTAFELVLARFRSDPALPDTELRFPLVALAEPPKTRVLARKPGETLPRRAEVHVLHHPDNRAWLALIDLTGKRVLQVTPLAGQPALAGEEYAAAAAIVRAHEPWQRALRTRGLDPARAYLDVWAGTPGLIDERNVAQASHGRATRVVQCLTFMRRADGGKPDNPYDRPVEGLVVSVDLNARRVLELVDRGPRPVIAETGNAAQSQALKPLLVQEPAGSELTLEGHFVRYRNWQFYAVLHPRDGLILYDVRYRDRGKLRRVAYRLSLSEIYVPYGIPDANWALRHAFDVGEYNAGTTAQQLVPGEDVPNNARLIDAQFFSDLGPTADNPDGKVDMPATLAVYERGAGMIWTRTDPVTRERDSRQARELVVAWNTMLGNYIYAFDWIFKLDGSIEVKAHLHGTTLNRGTGPEPERSAPKVGKDARGTWVAAPHHQHFLSFRLDLDIDGTANQLMEMEVAPLADPQFKNAFDTRTQMLTREGFRDVEPRHSRHWHIESATIKNPFGKPTGYALEPESLAFPYSAADYEVLARAAFAEHALWFTRQRDDERYAAGEFPYQSAEAGAGLPAYTTPADVIQGQDIVLWYTTGFTHIARPEDYPVMPVETLSFKLQPRGFFDRNPALEVGRAE